MDTIDISTWQSDPPKIVPSLFPYPVADECPDCRAPLDPDGRCSALRRYCEPDKDSE